MRNFKKVIAAGLALLMLALSVNVSFAAEEYSDAEAVAVAKVNAAAVMTGTDKGFEPTKTLTRAEAAAIFVRMKGISKSTVDQNAGTTLFNDVAASHWAAGYINVASNYGIIKGVGANKFAPEKEVSVAEFYTMAIRALNAGQLVEAEGTWPTNYINFAIENGLAEDVSQIYTATATRLTAAIIAANTLEANMWAKKSVRTNSEITWEETGDLLAEKLLNLTVRRWDTTDGKYYTLTKPVNTVSNLDKLVNGEDVVDTCDLSNIKVGMTYEYWLNKDGDIVGLWIPVNNDSVKFTEIKKISTTEITLVVDGKEKKYDIKSTALPVVVINEAKQTVNSIADLYTDNTDPTPDTGLLLPNKNLDGVAYVDDGVLKQIYMTTFNKYGIVDEVTAKKVTFKSSKVGIATYSPSIAADPIRIDDDDYEYFLTKDGEAMKFADLKENDAIRYYTYGKKIVAEVIDSVAEGKITNINTTDKFIKIDGTKYDYDANLAGLGLDKEVKIFVNQANKVCMYQLEEDAKSDVAVLKSIRNVTNKYGDETVEIILAYTDGTESDVLSLDVEETLKKNDKTHAGTLKAEYDVVDEGSPAGEVLALRLYDGTTVNLKYVLGQPVCFSINGNEVVIKKLVDEYKSQASGSFVVNEKTKSYVTVDSAKAFIDADTEIMYLKADGTKNYAYKVEMISFEDLDYKTTALTDYYVIGYDADAKSIDAIVIKNDLSRAKDENFGFITRVSSIKYDDKDAVELDVIYADGSTDTLIANASESGSSYDTTYVAGRAFDFALKDKLVTTNTTAVTAGDLAANKTVADIDFANNEIKLTGETTWHAVAEDVLVLFKDGSKYTVKDLADIEEYVSGDKEYSSIVSSFKAKDAENNTTYEQVIIVYETITVQN